jgi:hypothetical protein
MDMLKLGHQLDLYDLLSPGSQLVSEHLQLTFCNFMANLAQQEQPLPTNDGPTQDHHLSVRHLKALN